MALLDGAAQPGASVGHREPQRGAEPPRIERGSLAHDGIAPASEPAERVGDERDLGVHLGDGRERGRSQPPHPSATWGHTGVIRSGDGSIIRTTVPCSAP